MSLLVHSDVLQLICCIDGFTSNKILYLSPQALCKASSFYAGICRNKQNQFSTVHSCDHWSKTQGLGATQILYKTAVLYYWSTGPDANNFQIAC